MSLTVAVSIGNIIGSGIYNNSLKINLGGKKEKKMFWEEVGIMEKGRKRIQLPLNFGCPVAP